MSNMDGLLPPALTKYFKLFKKTIMKFINSILIIVTLAACTSNKTVNDEQPVEVPTDETMVSLTDAQVKTAGIMTGKPEMRMLTAALKVNGVVDVPPQNRVTVSFPMGGYLKSTRLLPGMHVRKGEVLAVMEDQAYIQLQQDYLIAKSKLYFAQKEFERQKFLNTSKSTSDKAFEQIESEYRAQRIITSSLGEKLRLIHINPNRLNEGNISRTVALYAPITGYVSAVNVNAGKYVNQEDILFELVNPADLHVSLTVFEKDLPIVRTGQRVEVAMTNEPDKKYLAKVHFIGRSLDDNRSTTVHCDFTGPKPQWLPGMFVNATVETSEHNAVVIPEEAVVQSGNQHYIFVQKGKNMFERIGVTTGTSNEGFIQIVHPSAGFEHKTIIVKNAYAALMKMENKAEE
jgi:membrane fusion protein, heavy metal efflux system